MDRTDAVPGQHPSSEAAIQQSQRLEQMQKDHLGSLHDLKESVLASQAQSAPHLHHSHTHPNAAAEEELPPPWVEYFSEGHQIPYYFNPESGESSWERPKFTPLDPHSQQQSHPSERALQITPGDGNSGHEHSEQQEEEEGQDNEEEDFMDEDEEEALYQRLLQKQQQQRQLQQQQQHNSNQSPSRLSPSSSQRTPGISLSQQREKVDLMYFRAEESTQRKEARRQEFINQQAQEHTGRPRLDTQSYKSQVNWDAMSLSERSAVLQANKLAKAEAMRAALEQEEQRAMRSTPVITKKSQQLAPRRGVDDMLAWDQERRERREAMARLQAQREAEQYHGKPAVAKQTNKLLGLQDGGREMQDGMKVEERLLEYEEKKRLKRIQAVQKQNREAREMANGTTNSAAATAAAAAHNRLYHLAQKKQLEYAKQEERQSNGHCQTNSFQPQINKKSQQLAQKVRPQHVPVEDSLAYRGQMASQKQQIRQQRSELQAKIRANESKINPVSDRIVREKYQNDASGGASERLSKPIGTVKQKTRESINEPTFQPQLTTHKGSRGDSYTSSEYRNSGDSVYNRSQKWLQEKQSRLQRERTAKELNELQQCSFKPQIVAQQQSLNDSYDLNRSGDYDNRAGGSIAERQADWATKRDLKIEMGRREREAQMRDECAFIPSYAHITSSNPQAILDQMDKSLLASSSSSSSSSSVIKKEETHRKHVHNTRNNDSDSEDENLSPHKPIPAIGASNRNRQATKKRQHRHPHSPREPSLDPYPSSSSSSTPLPSSSSFSPSSLAASSSTSERGVLVANATLPLPPSRSNYHYPDKQNHQRQQEVGGEDEHNKYADDECNDYEYDYDYEYGDAPPPPSNLHEEDAYYSDENVFNEEQEAQPESGDIRYRYGDGDGDGDGYGYGSRRQGAQVHPAVYMQEEGSAEHTPERSDWQDQEEQGDEYLYPPPLPPEHSYSPKGGVGSTYRYTNTLPERGVGSSFSSDLDEMDSMSLLEQLANTDFVDNSDNYSSAYELEDDAYQQHLRLQQRQQQYQHQEYQRQEFQRQLQQEQDQPQHYDQYHQSSTPSKATRSTRRRPPPTPPHVAPASHTPSTHSDSSTANSVSRCDESGGRGVYFDTSNNGSRSKKGRGNYNVDIL